MLAVKSCAAAEEHMSSKLVNCWCLLALKPLSVLGPSFRASESLPLFPEEKLFTKLHPRVPCLLTFRDFQNEIVPCTCRDVPKLLTP